MVQGRKTSKTTTSSINSQGNGGPIERPDRLGMGVMVKGGRANGDFSSASRRSGGNADYMGNNNNGGIEDKVFHHPSQYNQEASPTNTPSGLMEYRMGNQAPLSRPQEGIITMKENRHSTPQWSETKTKV